MGIKGTVRRSVDSHFIHTNIDIDLIITEEPDYGRPDKPEEIFHIIEHFCLGKRRLYLFGRDSTIRPGWLTVGPELSESYFDKEVLSKLFEQDPSGNFTGSSERIDMLRPKTPPMKAKQQQLALNSALNAISSGPPINTANIANNSVNISSNSNMMQGGMSDGSGIVMNQVFHEQSPVLNNNSNNFMAMQMGNPGDSNNIQYMF